MNFEPHHSKHLEGTWRLHCPRPSPACGPASARPAHMCWPGMSQDLDTHMRDAWTTLLDCLLPSTLSAIAIAFLCLPNSKSMVIQSWVQHFQILVSSTSRRKLLEWTYVGPWTLYYLSRDWNLTNKKNWIWTDCHGPDIWVTKQSVTVTGIEENAECYSQEHWKLFNHQIQSQWLLVEIILLIFHHHSSYFIIIDINSHNIIVTIMHSHHHHVMMALFWIWKRRSEKESKVGQ